MGFRYWWTIVYPGLFIVLFTLGWNLLGDALRDVLDPLSRRK
jgi:peptide/nickel transport system permease protein